ncbi:MAG: choice-of-anchor D domain-containing protein [Myxococcaceae bacterium]
MTRLLVHITSACLAVSLSACAPTPPTKEPPAPPGPTVHEPTRVERVQDCGEIPLGGRNEAILRLHAPATRDITAQLQVSQVLRLSLPEPNESGIHTASIPAGNTQELAIGCRGDQLGGFAADVRIDLVEESRTQVVTLTGRVKGARLELNPKKIDFGDVAVFPGRASRTYARRSLLLRNEGNAPLQFEAETPFRVEELDGSAAEEFFAQPAGGVLGDIDPAPGQNTRRLDLTFAPATAGRKQVLLYIESDDPRAPTKAVRLQANAVELPPCQLEITPALIDFGQLASNQVTKAIVQLRNLGTTPNARCLVSGMRVSGANAFFTSSPESLELPPGAVASVELTAVSHGTPDPAGRVVTGALEFLVSDPDQPERSVPLRASLSPSCLELSSPALVLNAYGPACAVRDSLVLKNVCSEPMTLMGIDAPQPPFTLVQTPAIPTAGFQLDPGEQTMLSVRYAPDGRGLHAGSIRIALQEASVATTRQLLLHGIAPEAPMHTDTFVQPEPIGPDVLIVIDNGEPLAPLFDSVRRNLASFAKYARSVGREVRIAVTTTAGSGGVGRAELVPDATGEVLLSTSAQDFEPRFNELISGLTMGASERDVLETAIDAARGSQMTLREAAPFSVIAITAASDRSPAPVDGYEWQLEELKPDRRIWVSFNAIGPYSGGNSCTPEEDDGRLARLALLTDGVREDICTPDWETSLERLGTSHFGSRYTIPLSRPIDPFRGATSVRIDGLLVPSVDKRGATAWTVAPEVHGVEFEPLYAPQPGQVTEITYPVACWE